jgi:hypothetical protein
MTEMHKAFFIYLGALFAFAHFLREFGFGSVEVLVALLLVVALTLRYMRRRTVEVRTRQGRVGR